MPGTKPGYKPPPRGRLPGKVKAPEDKKAPGRKRKEPPANALEIIRATAAMGANRLGVAQALGTCDDVLVRWMDERPEFAEAYKQGREKERQTLHNVLYSAATEGEGRDAIIAAMFLLKARHGYREGDQEAQANRVSINFQIPGAQPLDKFMVIENEPDNRAERLSTTAIVRS